MAHAGHHNRITRCGVAPAINRSPSAGKSSLSSYSGGSSIGVITYSAFTPRDRANKSRCFWCEPEYFIAMKYVFCVMITMCILRWPYTNFTGNTDATRLPDTTQYEPARLANANWRSRRAPRGERQDCFCSTWTDAPAAAPTIYFIVLVLCRCFHVISSAESSDPLLLVRPSAARVNPNQGHTRAADFLGLFPSDFTTPYFPLKRFS